LAGGPPAARTPGPGWPSPAVATRCPHDAAPPAAPARGAARPRSVAGRPRRGRPGAAWGRGAGRKPPARPPAPPPNRGWPWAAVPPAACATAWARFVERAPGRGGVAGLDHRHRDKPVSQPLPRPAGLTGRRGTAGPGGASGLLGAV